MATDSEMIDALRVGAQTMDTLGRMVRMQENGVSPWWWHGAIMDEMERLAALDYPVYSCAGIAGNLRGFNAMDTEKYLRQMISAGVVAETEPAWDFEDLWVTLS